MASIKKLTFNLNQSRRITRSAERHKTTPENLIKKYQNIVDLIYKSWNDAYGNSQEIDFETFFLSVMRYAEYIFRLKKTEEDMLELKKIMVTLEDAIEEYTSDYNKLHTIENALKERGVTWV